MVSQDIPWALATQGRPLRGRPCVGNEKGMSWETTDVLSADTQMSCLLAQQMSCLQTQQMSCLQKQKTYVRPRQRSRKVFFPGKNPYASGATLPQALFFPEKRFVRPRQSSRRVFFPREKRFGASGNAHARFSCRPGMVLPLRICKAWGGNGNLITNVEGLGFQAQVSLN